MGHGRDPKSWFARVLVGGNNVTHGIENDIDNRIRRGDARRVIDRVRPHLSLHSFRHETLRAWDDHVIRFGQQKPAGPV
jgi:hypothetical protein